MLAQRYQKNMLKCSKNNYKSTKIITETYLKKKKTHWLNTIIADIIIMKIQEGKTKQK